MTTTYEPVPKAEAASLIGEGVHTGLRKGSEAPSSMPLWRAISGSTDSAWADAIAFCLWGLESMGYVLCRKVEALDPVDVLELLGIPAPAIPTNEDGSTDWAAFAQALQEMRRP